MDFDSIRRAVNSIEDGIDQVEFTHTRETRLAILCGAAEPTENQNAIATKEAVEQAEKLKGTNETEN